MNEVAAAKDARILQLEREAAAAATDAAEALDRAAADMARFLWVHDAAAASPQFPPDCAVV